jgi:hypothetical protein
MGKLSFIITLVAVVATVISHPYPVPTPKGGRNDVHGWLILPIELPQFETGDKILSRPAWFSHHVPEFWHDSPHDFQIIFQGEIIPTQAVFPPIKLEPLNLPVVPHQGEAEDFLLIYEYSMTPPSPFSLNDLLNGDISSLYGVYYNGSFDTPYPRIPESLSVINIQQLTTAVYLDEYAKNNYPNLSYLSYPRAFWEISKTRSDYFYLAHEIHAQPDFDHVVHGKITNCSDLGYNVTDVINRPGLAWEVVGVPNTLDNKLTAGQVLPVHVKNGDKITGEITCQLSVLESIHCMIGPGFMENC